MELGVSSQLRISAPAQECPVAATLQRGQSCSVSVMILFTQKYSIKGCWKKYLKQVHVIESRIPEAAFVIFVYSELGNASSLGCVSGRVHKHTQPHREGGISPMPLGICHLFNHALFWISGSIKSTCSWIPGPRRMAFERVTRLSATAYYVKGITVALRAAFYQQNLTARLSKIPRHLTQAERDGAGLIPS